jgi:tetratricopeptide (TPR) repeat protein
VGLAQEALSRAEALDPQLAEIHNARFEFYFSKYGNWDLARAAREGRQAVALNPSVGHSAVGTIYDHVGLDETTGLRESRRALELDPTNFYSQYRLIESYQLYGRFDEAIEAQRRFFDTPGPEYALIRKGRFDEAQPLLEEAIRKNSGDLRARGRLALLMALRGKFKEAEAAIPPILEQARNNRAYPLFGRDRYLDRIRHEPAFVQFMNELKPRWEGYRREFE